MTNVIKVMEATAKYFSKDGQIETIKEGNTIIVKYNSVDIDLKADLQTKRAIVLKEDHIYFYCYTDSTLRNDMDINTFLDIHSNKVTEEFEAIETIEDLQQHELYNAMLTNSNDYYIEIDNKYYILDIDNNKLVKSYNSLIPVKDILISNTVKNYIINLCLDDLPL